RSGSRARDAPAPTARDGVQRHSEANRVEGRHRNFGGVAGLREEGKLTGTVPRLTAAAARRPAATPHPVHWKHKWKKRLVNWARWSHIYLSMVSFAILFFFAATGLTLNHQDWFAAQQRTVVHKGTLDRGWLGKDVAQLQIVEQLRKVHGIKAGLGDLRVEDEQIAVNFKGPGYTSDA